MANELPAPIVIGTKGGKFWEFPDALWRKIPALQAKRLRRTVNDQILPLLYKLEDLFPRPKGTKIPHITGMGLAKIEESVPCTVMALHLFDVALEQGLITFADKGAKKGKKPGPKTPVGSCGMSLAQARNFFLEGAAGRILEKAGHDPKKLSDMLGNYELTDPSALNKLELMARFDPQTITEIRDGLRGHMGKLFECDEAFFEILKNSKPAQFIRPLRRALGKKFPSILEWSPDFMRAVADDLGHSAKIIALGPSILEATDPGVITALGQWPMEETLVNDKAKGKKKAYVTRIEQVRRQLGDEFKILMRSNAAVVTQAGTWKDDEIERIKFYVGYINADVIEALSVLPFAYTVNIMDGLWSTLSREFMETQITTPEGIAAIKALIAKLQEMGLATTAPEKVKGMIENKLFDEQFRAFLK